MLVTHGVQKGITELSITLETYLGYGKGERTSTEKWVELGVKMKLFSGKKEPFSNFNVGSDRPPCPAQIRFRIFK